MPLITTTGGGSVRGLGRGRGRVPSIVFGEEVDLPNSLSFVSQKTLATQVQLLGSTFSQDGRYLFTSDFADFKIRRYTLSTPWNLSSCPINADGGQEWLFTDSLSDLVISDNGLHIFCTDRDETDTFFRLDLSSPFNLVGAQKTQTSSFTTSGEANGGGTLNSMAMSPDGTQFITGVQAGDCPHFSLTTVTPFDITNLTLTGQTSITSLNAGFSSVLGIGMDRAGLNMYVPQFSSAAEILHVKLPTPWNMTGAYEEKMISLPSAVFGSKDQIFVNADPKRLYICDYGNNTVYEYTW